MRLTFSLTDSLPAGITFTSSSVSQGVYDAATGVWTIGTLNNGAIATITLTGTVEVGQGGKHDLPTSQLQRRVIKPTLLRSEMIWSKSIIVNDAADLVTVKSLASGNSTPAEGDEVTFEITVTNGGAAQAN